MNILEAIDAFGGFDKARQMSGYDMICESAEAVYTLARAGLDAQQPIKDEDVEAWLRSARAAKDGLRYLMDGSEIDRAVAIMRGLAAQLGLAKADVARLTKELAEAGGLRSQ